MSRAFIVVTDGLDETQRSLIHYQIKEHAEDWWHEFPDIWVVVGGQSPVEWRDRLGVFAPLLPSGVLVIQLAGESSPEGKIFAARMRSETLLGLARRATR